MSNEKWTKSDVSADLFCSPFGKKQNCSIICFIFYLPQRIIRFLQMVTTKGLNAICKALTEIQRKQFHFSEVPSTFFLKY